MRNVAGAPRKGDLAARKLLVEGWNNCRCAWLPCQISLTLETDQAAASEPPHCTYKVNTAVCWLSPISDSSLFPLPPLSSLLWPLSHVLTYVQLDTITYIHALGVCCNVAVSRYLWFLYPQAIAERNILASSLPSLVIRSNSWKFVADSKFENQVLREKINRVLSVCILTQSISDAIGYTYSFRLFSKNKFIMRKSILIFEKEYGCTIFFFLNDDQAMNIYKFKVSWSWARIVSIGFLDSPFLFR